MVTEGVDMAQELGDPSPADSQRFNGEYFVVTGAGSGIGLSIVTRLANQGATVLATDINADSLEAVIRENAPAGRESVRAVDVRHVDEIIAMVDDARDRWGGIDGLVNCAGVAQTVPLLEVTPGDWDRMLEINLRGTFFCLQATARVMMQAKRGAIVNLSSALGGRTGRAFSPHYGASKARIISVTRSAAMALAPHIRVNAICPGMINTPMWAQLESEWSEVMHVDREEVTRRQAENAPLKRAGRPPEVAAVASFLLSDEASYITGQAYHVDGGSVMV